MAEAPPQLSLEELARRLGAELRGDGSRRVRGVAPLESAAPDEVAFYANPRYKAHLLATRAAGVIVAETDERLVPPGAARIVSPQPYLTFARASALFNPEKKPAPGIDPRAHVSEGAHVDPSASIGPGAVVGSGARIGPGSVLHPSAVVLDEARVGRDCVLWPGAVVRERCVLGDRVILQPNAVVGSDGFGFAFDPEGDGTGPMHRKVPQAGIARIEDDVELGACTCVDRATLGETVVGRGTKVDNLVQIAHNVEVGPLSLLVAQCGIAGSTKIGAGVILAGQAGLVGHLRVGDGARVGAQSGVSRDVEDGEAVSGAPAIAHRDWLRLSAALPRLPDLLREVRRLGERVQELEQALGRKA